MVLVRVGRDDAERARSRRSAMKAGSGMIDIDARLVSSPKVTPQSTISHLPA